MAKSQFKAGGPTRGRRRVRKIGMGSGKYLLARKEARKGVSAQPQAAEKPESKGGPRVRASAPRRVPTDARPPR
ncbi:MAG: hypothetical protein VXW31_07375, partial [Planctomycetota bacterium]|nr:hypothetical protein [Planctomycetota bacterium]